MGHRKTNTLTGKLSSFFKEAVKAPPEPPPEPEPEEPELPPLTTQTDEWEETAIQEEQIAPQQTDIIDELNSATQRWKETGDSGLHLQAPVPLSERARIVWDKFAHDVSPKIANTLKHKIEAVAQAANTKLNQLQKPRTPAQTTTTPQKTLPTPPAPTGPAAVKTQPQTRTTTPAEPTPQQIDSAIIASWMEVLAKTEEKAPQNEREEIEKLYKQLSQ